MRTLTTSLAVLAAAMLYHPLTAEAATTCPSITAFGGIPDDGLDDRAALQRSMTEAGCVNLREAPGVYHVDVPTGPRGNCLLTMPGGAGEFRVYGMPGARVAFRGDAGRDDISGLCVGDGFALDRVELDGDGFRSTNEHSRLLFWVGADRVRIERSRFNFPPRVGEKRGDCIHGVGYTPDLISTGTVLIGNRMVCARSGWTWHSGTEDAFVEGNEICAGDQALDGEGDQVGAPWLVRNLVVRGNRFIRCGIAEEGELNVQVVRGHGVTFELNHFEGRGVDLAEVSNLALRNNNFDFDIPGGDPVIMVRKASTQTVISGGIIRRYSNGGPVISIERRETGPTGIRIDGVTIQQHGTYHAIQLRGVADTTISDVDLEYTGGAGMAAVTIEGIGALISDTTVSDLRTTGPLHSSLEISGAYIGAGRTTYRHSSSSAPVRCHDSPLGPLVIEGNVGPAPVGCAVAP
jgi:hypothetical protein